MATSQPALAATITWGAATDIVGANDVFTGGKSVYAYGFGAGYTGDAPGAPGQITVNGVSFTTSSGFSMNPGVTANVNIAGVPGPRGPSTTIFIGAYFPLSSPAGYNGLLTGAAFNSQDPTDPVESPATNSMTVTLNNLTAGVHYAVQVWSANVDYGGTDTTYDGAVSLRMRPGSDETGTGQYAIGSFWADGTSQVMSLTGTNFQINALQVRDVPVPATIALLGLGLVGIGAARRKQAWCTYLHQQATKPAQCGLFLFHARTRDVVYKRHPQSTITIKPT
jgi:hypothetical protein